MLSTTEVATYISCQLPYCLLKQLAPFFNVIRNHPQELFQRTISQITQPLQDVAFQPIFWVDLVTGNCISDWGDPR
jgi:hypothetical protein